MTENKSKESSPSNFSCAFKSLGNKITKVNPWKCGTLLSVSMYTLCNGHLYLLSWAFQVQNEILFSNSSHLESGWEELIENLNKLVTPM